MGRTRFAAFLAGVAALAMLGLPPAASAGTYTWSQPFDFTATAPGANPDHDHYGGAPWTYVESNASQSSDPSTFTLLDGFVPNPPGWTASKDPGALVGVKTPQRMVLTAARGRFVAVGWSAPLAGTVSVTGSVSPDPSDTLCPPSGPTWSLDLNGTQVAGSPAGSFSMPVSVTPGDAIYLAVSPSALHTCDTADVSFTIQDTEPTPAVTVSSPAPGAVISGAQPIFAGSASTGFGDSSQVKVNVYDGSSATGSPFETLTANRSGGAYSVGPNPSLPDGTYTVQAEQGDIASPPDVGLSPPQTFRIKVNAPLVTLTQPAAGSLLRQSDERFSGSAGSSPGDSHLVSVVLHKGSSLGGQRVGMLTVTANGASWSGSWPGRLARGVYTAQAVQADDAGHTGHSQPHTFRVVRGLKVIGSPVRLDRSGRVLVAIHCDSAPGTPCAGTVLILTVQSFQPVPGGPTGKLRVLFAYVTLPGGKTTVIRRRLGRAVAQALRGGGSVRVAVTAALSPMGIVAARRVLR